MQEYDAVDSSAMIPTPSVVEGIETLPSDISEDVIVSLRGVSKSYDMGAVTVQALRRVTLRIARGSFVVLLGPSGSGKTTLLNVIGGIDLPTEGRITVDGTDLSSLHEAGLTAFRRNKVGFVFQFFNLIPTLTAQENVEIAARLVNDSLSSEEVLDRVSLGSRRDHFPSEMSGGEQQRVAIARALVKRPPLVLCDEPTGELDYETGKSVLALLRRLNEEEGISVMLATHNTALAGMADRVLTLRSGELVKVEEVDTPTRPDSLRW